MTSDRSDGYDTYMLEHDDNREYVVNRIVFAGLGADGKVLYKLPWFGYGPEDDQ